MAAAKFHNIDEYIATFPADVQEVLEQVRRTIKEAAPGSHERISYQMPTITLGGYSIYFSAWKRHIGVYGQSGALEAYKEQVAPYATAKGTLQFPLQDPMPVALISEIVRFGVRESQEKAGRPG